MCKLKKPVRYNKINTEQQNVIIMKKTFKIEDIKEIRGFNVNNSTPIKVFYARSISLIMIDKLIVGAFNQFESEACLPGGDLSTILKESVIETLSSKCQDNLTEVIRFVLK
ncbi:MAG: hypothetical protein COA50_16730 [Flavobacteriaceae bacterium]|nr:MAG: hypothetical protein COA50_16730 [Flavobacteriaceae bacterium]